jgi:hypothetical protein
MKTKISKLLAVGLTVALLASLMAFAVPVSARTLGWSTESIPSASDEVIEDDVQVTDIAVVEDGVTIYAGSGSTTLYKSTDGGVKWSTITTNHNTDIVAAAPDESKIIAVADTSNQSVSITDNGGISWTTLTGIASNLDALTDMAISAESAGKHYIAVGGNSGGDARVYRYDIGAASPSWLDISTAVGTKYSGFSSANTTAAVAFSPNFPSDQVLLAVTLTVVAGTGTDNVSLEIWSENLDKWNTSAGFSDYPARVTYDTGITDIDAASIALGPDYLGSDEAMRLAFVGLDLAGDEDKNGIHRVADVVAKELKIGDVVRINSVAYDGAALVAGKNDNNTVYYCLDPTTSTPTVTPTSTLKRPGVYASTGSAVCNKVVLAWAGADVVAGVSGKGAFSISRDNGKAFNDISLVATPLTTLSDVAVAPDGSKVYIVAYDTTDDITSVWRKSPAKERILAVTGSDFIVRIAPDDPDVIYVAKKSGTAIYYTTDAGDVRWQIRTCRVSIEDLAIEGDGTVAYALTSGGEVSKSTNGGFTWGSPQDTKLSSGNMITSLSEGNLLVGDNSNWVSYSTDSGSTWTKIAPPVNATTSGEVSATATGLANEDYIFATNEAANTGIYRFQIGVSTSEWTEIKSSTVATYSAYGIVLKDGMLYVSTANATASTTFRTLSPTAWPTAFVSWSEMTSTAAFTTEPQGLKLGGDKLWAIDTEASPNKLYSFSDTITAVAPTLNLPQTDAALSVNPITGYASDVTFSWQKPSDYVTGYELKIYMDSAAKDELVKKVVISGPPAEAPVVAQVVGKDISGAEFTFMPGVTYYWKVRVHQPVYSPYSEVRSFTVAEAEVTPPVIIEPAETPEITITPPEVVVEIPESPPVTVTQEVITPAWIYVVIFIGAVLLIAVIILIVRTRRAV